MQSAGMSLIANEIETNLPDSKITAFGDSYPNKQKEVTIPFDKDFIENLI
tara:strand:- start:215 stop:364 length:150 start_codon:yes stop_codon:yes gene_type:complete